MRTRTATRRAYVYDGFGDRTQMTSPDSGTTVITYDPDRNLTQDRAGGLAHDERRPMTPLDRTLTVTYPSQTALNVSRTYDQTGTYGFGIGRLTSCDGSRPAAGLASMTSAAT